MPDPEAEYPFAAEMRRRWRFDWAFPAYKVAVEVDGGQWQAHGGRHSRDTDRDKLNHAAMLGWRVFRFSPQMLRRDPEGCIRMVEKATYDR